MIGLAKLMGRMVMPSNALVAFLTHGAVQLLRLLPSLRHFIDDPGIKPKNRFPKGLFVCGRACNILARGGQIPQGWVRDGEGRIALSDGLLDGGLTLLGFGLHPATLLSPDMYCRKYRPVRLRITVLRPGRHARPTARLRA